MKGYIVEPPNKGHFGNGPFVLCSEIVPISEVHDFSTHFDCIILNKSVNALKCMIRAVEIIYNQVVGMFCFQYQHSTGQNRYLDSREILLSRMRHNIATA